MSGLEPDRRESNRSDGCAIGSGLRGGWQIGVAVDRAAEVFFNGGLAFQHLVLILLSRLALFQFALHRRFAAQHREDRRQRFSLAMQCCIVGA